MIPSIDSVRDIGIPFNTTFTSSDAANTVRRLLFMLSHSLSELSKTAFIPLNCAIVRPHLDYAMRGLRQVLHKERLRYLNLFSLECRLVQADLKMDFRVSKSETDLSPYDSVPRPPRSVHNDGMLQRPIRLRRCSAFSVSFEKLEQIICFNLHVTRSARL